MLDTIRLEMTDLLFYFAVVRWRQNDLDGVAPARINVSALKEMVEEGKVIDFSSYRDKAFGAVLEGLNDHGLDVVVKDFFQLYKQGSWLRDITVVLDQERHRVVVEASLPKFFMGQNVDLLFDYKAKIYDFVYFLYAHFKCRQPDLKTIDLINLGRVDFCYFYRFPGQIHALDFIRAFRSWFKHKRKKIHHYDTSVMFVGRSYSMKFYMKLDEFRNHDKKEIYKKVTALQEKSESVENQLTGEKLMCLMDTAEKMANGMVRCEFTVRKQKLNYDGLFVLGDLFKLDIVAYYEKLVESQGVMKIGKTGKDDVFLRLKDDKKLLQYSALLELYGPDRIKEVYSRSKIYEYNKMLLAHGVQTGDFNVLKNIHLGVLHEHKELVNACEDSYHESRRFANGELF